MILIGNQMVYLGEANGEAGKQEILQQMFR